MRSRKQGIEEIEENWETLELKIMKQNDLLTLNVAQIDGLLFRKPHA